MTKNKEHLFKVINKATSHTGCYLGLDTNNHGYINIEVNPYQYPKPLSKSQAKHRLGKTGIIMLWSTWKKIDSNLIQNGSAILK